MTPPIHVATAETTVSEETTVDAPLLEHSYDDIREYDNPLPGWWRAIFWASIVFAAGYWVWFHVAGWGESPDQHYRASLAEYEGQKEQREAADAASVSEGVLATNIKDQKLVQHGAAIFASRCAACHNKEGQGLIGPNLTDNYQLHGATRMDVLKTVRDGVIGTAMPAWGEQMAATDVVAVTTFVTTLRGKNLTGKEPQGAPVDAFAQP
jgi:cytochrome c oxidase cbb3-type subunit 3